MAACEACFCKVQGRPLRTSVSAAGLSLYKHLAMQIQRCDGILEHMEGLLGRFQSDLGQVSDEIRTLQVRLMY